MPKRTLNLSDELYAYLLDASLREPPVLRRLREETAHHPRSKMQIAPEQGQLMALLIRLMGARLTLEVGVFTGYSSLAVALALPSDGRIIACDVDEEVTSIARRYWREAGIAHKVDLRLAPALSTLDSLLADGGADTFDFAFIDADKVNYDSYFERALSLVRPGGLIALDNAFWGGKVADAAVQDANTSSIRALNQKLRDDDRVHLSLVPIGDGLTLAMKR